MHAGTGGRLQGMVTDKGSHDLPPGEAGLIIWRAIVCVPLQAWEHGEKSDHAPGWQSHGGGIGTQGRTRGTWHAPSASCSVCTPAAPHATSHAPHTGVGHAMQAVLDVLRKVHGHATSRQTRDCVKTGQSWPPGVAADTMARERVLTPHTAGAHADHTDQLPTWQWQGGRRHCCHAYEHSRPPPKAGCRMTSFCGWKPTPHVALQLSSQPTGRPTQSCLQGTNGWHGSVRVRAWSDGHFLPPYAPCTTID